MNYAMTAVNPANGKVLKTYQEHSAAEAKKIVDDVNAAQLTWKQTPFAERARLMKKAASLLRERKTEYGTLMTEEMGKLLSAAVAEVEKSALGCDYYADNGEKFMADEEIKTAASKSFVAYEPLGTIKFIISAFFSSLFFLFSFFFFYLLSSVAFFSSCLFFSLVRLISSSFLSVFSFFLFPFFFFCSVSNRVAITKKYFQK